MSRDIRSFFVRKDQSSYDKQNESVAKSSKKRTLRVIESDSEDDDVLNVSKPAQKKPKESKGDKKEPEKKKESSKETSKPKQTAVNATSFFGTSPVQQKHQTIKKSDKTPNDNDTNSLGLKEKSSGKKEKSKKSTKYKGNGTSTSETYNIENDDGLDERLLQISETELEKLSKKEEEKKTPKKEEKEIKSTKEDGSEKKKTPMKEENNPIKTALTPGSADSKSGKKNFPDSEQKRRNAESYQRYLNRGGPKNPGSKEIPKGTPSCLKGYTFVISGVLESMEREEVVELIQKCGGRVTSTVSGKTSFIVVGDDAGQSKLEKANKLGTKKLTEDELLDLIRTKSKSSVDDESGSSQDFIEGTPKKDTSVYFKSEIKAKRTLETDISPTENSKKARKTIEILAPKFDNKPVKTSDESSGYETQMDSQSSDSSALKELSNDVSAIDLIDDCLLVDKYKPKTTKQIIGQLGDKSNVKKLIYWLENWYKNNLYSTGKKSKPASWQSQDGSSFKAALLSGPPGVGKTTTVQLVCKELGLSTVEFNASNTRSKKTIKEEVSELLKLKYKLCSVKEKLYSKHVVVMDEVDGVAGNEDRGGIQELIQIIKTTKVPIVCMCNDRNHPKVRSLVNYCYDLRFNKPRVEQIKGAMLSVCYKEKIKISNETLEDIIINANQDIRQVLHNLSLWSVRDRLISSEQAKKDSANAKKPLNLGPWDVTRKVFSASEHSSMTFREKEELFFQDYNLGPLFIQDTYIRVKPHKAKNDIKATLNLLSKAADAILWGDIVERKIRSENAWNLLPIQAIFSAVLPGHYMEGHVQGQIQFPIWLGKNSKSNRFDRILQELQIHMRLGISGSKEAVNLDYLPAIKDAITRPLLMKGADGVAETLQIMSDYNLTKEDIDNIMELSQWPGRKDVFTSIDSKVKAALTRAYNKEGKPVPYATSRSVKKATPLANEQDIEGLEIEAEEEVDEDEDNIDLDLMIKKGKSKNKLEKEEPKGKEKKEKKTTKKEKKMK